MFYRLNTAHITGAMGSLFSHADSKTIYGMVFRNNMDNSSFNTADESIMKTIQSRNQAYMGRFDIVNSYLCQVNYFI